MTSTLEYCVVYFVSDRILLREPTQSEICHKVNNEYFYWIGIVFAQMKVGDMDSYPYLTVSMPNKDLYSAIPLDEKRIIKPIPARLERIYGNNGQIKRVHIEKCYGNEFVKTIYSLLTMNVVSAIYFEWGNLSKLVNTYDNEKKEIIEFFDTYPVAIAKVIKISPTVVNSYAKTAFSRQIVIADTLYQFYKGSPLEEHIHRVYGMDFIVNPSKELRLTAQSRSYIVTKSSLIIRPSSIQDYIQSVIPRLKDLMYIIILASLCLHASDIIHTNLGLDNLSIKFCELTLNATIFGWPIVIKRQRDDKIYAFIVHAIAFSNAFLKVEEDQMDKFISDRDPSILGKLSLFKYDLTTCLSDQKFYVCEIIDLLISFESLQSLSHNPRGWLKRMIDILKKMLSEPTQHKKSPLLELLEINYPKRNPNRTPKFII
jgi:hypothetical protein